LSPDRLPDDYYLEGGRFYQEVKKEMDYCWEHHTNCPNQITPILPSRVIDVEVEDLTAQIRLHISATGERASYTALSYCWGRNQQITTTDDTLVSKTAGLELHSLPQTIQDAVTVTRGLGIRCLWVDALCIIQDSEKDRRAKINNMGLIYKNASLTIVAAGAGSAQEGFLRIPECLLQLYFPEGDFANVSFTLLREPIKRRAWTFQEALLSPRILYFAHTPKSRINCQVGIRYYNGLEFRSTGLLDFPVTLPPSVFTQKTSRKSQARLWTNIIKEYSVRRLTNPEDRLLALSAIAKELCNLWSDDYLAGMWRRFLIRHLGW
jgi:hypothetical protein